ncbi:hypothetical protein DKP76_10895 [Falsochrobactrum shanghaiense]|uniref:BON domain-containing protein n=1 Tax=Falsochrobactrum shanghaiense TaxID=2201899 RepID=A0A316J9R3_9HYPH|nr:BON domain-containing protein [Falsochrobactrum shanghaiense]PWL18214.1 hypothetical protein DKP76_10895 [Falsochrobactrum shanghaiense]
MNKWFWPGVTCTAALTALALWFGVNRVEADLAAQAAAALAPFGWANFDIDGRDLTLKGTAPDQQAQDAALSAAGQIRGIRTIADLTALLQIAEPYVFKIVKNADTIILSGYVPENSLRDKILNAAEMTDPQAQIDDQLTLARGNQPQFAVWALFALELSRKFATVEVEISGDALSVRGQALNDRAYNDLGAGLKNPLPVGLDLANVDIAKP